MYQIAVLGGGNIGCLVTRMLATHKDYQLYVVDQASHSKLSHLHDLPSVHYQQLDINDTPALHQFFQQHKIQAVVSALPYFCNPKVAEAARELGMHYFDLTEDVAVTDTVKKTAAGATTAFVPQCGLAPGFISIVTHDLMTHFDTVDKALMRVGALPSHPINALKYSLTWSTDGVINEYGNTCYGIHDYQLSSLMPLEGLESIQIDGLLYEAFNTSGGLGTLAETYAGQVREMNYKTMRYPGHCAQMRLLMNDLRLNEARDLMKAILEKSVASTNQDVVIVYVSVSGMQQGRLMEETYVNKIYPQNIAGELYSAIQVSTSSGVCAVVDRVMSNPKQYTGFVRQEQFALTDFLNNRFGQYYRKA